MILYQIYFVCISFEFFKFLGNIVVQVFYVQFFVCDLGLCVLFCGDLIEQGLCLVQMIGVVIDLLDCFVLLWFVLFNLGCCYVVYGVVYVYYVSVGVVLLDIFVVGFGEQFIDEMCDVWMMMYGVVVQVMQEGVVSDVFEVMVV